MKRFLIVLASLLVLASAVAAQSQIKPVVYVGGGIALPMAPDFFKDYYKFGYGFGGGAGIRINPSIEVIAKVFYNTFPVDQDKYEEDALAVGDTVTADWNLRVIEFGIDVKYLLMAKQEDMKFKPFLIAGIGMGNGKVTGDNAPEDAESSTDFALSGGVGVDYMFSPKVGVWLEGRYTVVLTEDESTNYLPIRAGVKFLFGE